MPDRLVIDLAREGEASVLLAAASGATEVLSRSPLAWPLDAAMLADLRWYLEDYLLTPYGAWEERGPAVQERLAGWGDAVFGAVFGSGPARLAYERAWERGLPVMLRSADPGRLTLPWELMRDSVGPVALGASGICRGLPTADDPGTLDVPGTRLRVLMVSSGSAGADDTGYRLLARPLLERLTALRGNAELTILRPATFAALAEAVGQAAVDGEPFHVVHFDGYGMMSGSPAWNRETAAGRQTVTAAAGEGVLGFARPGGGRDYVGVSKVAAALAGGRLPLAVLSASQPGAVGPDLEASFATALLSAGCAAVVTMAYRLAAVAAAEFMVSFYESLLAGDGAGQAVAAGRRRLSARDGRPSPRGNVPLADWLVPVLYLGRDIRFRPARTARPAGARSLAAELDRIGAASRGPGVPRQPLMPAGAFVGRDGLFHQLETAALTQRVVVLTGPAGSGKTELAKGFARWWRDTGGTDGERLVLWHSFEPGAADPGLDAVVTAIGLTVFGAAFPGLDREQRLTRVKQLLGQRRALLVWDHLEPPPQAPDPADAPPPSDSGRRAALLDFLEWVRDHSVSTAIITSRAAEERLGPEHHVRVGALNQAEAAEYASHQIAPFPSAQRRRQHRSFGELLAWLDGDPSAIQLAMVSLETTDTASLLPRLRRAALPPGDGEGDRQTPFAACVRDAFGHLPGTALRLLPALSLLQGIADENVLTLFSHAEGVPGRFAGASQREWAQALDEAAQAGLIVPLGSPLYVIQAALPGYLAAEWRAADPEACDGERQAGEQALRSAYADYSRWILAQVTAGDTSAYTVVELQRQALGVALGHALAHHAWDDAEPILRALDAYWAKRGLTAEPDAWADRVLAAIADGGQASPETANDLWLLTAGLQANRRLTAGLPDEAERLYLQTVAYLRSQPESEESRRSMSVSYHQLGMLAQSREQLDESDDWYRKSLALKQEFGDRSGMARTYMQLGTNALLRHQLDKADDWYRKSLALWAELRDRPMLAILYHQLGTVDEQRGRLDEADDWYRRSLAISEEFGDRPVMASTYHQLGRTAYKGGRLREAGDWFRKAVAITEETGDRPTTATIYLELGVNAHASEQPDEGDGWYRKSLAVSEELGDRPRAAALCLELGVNARHSGRLQEAGGWLRRSLAVSEELGDRRLAAETCRQLGLTARQGRRLDEAEDWFRKLLAVSEELGNDEGMASTQLRLGDIAHGRGHPGEAEAWYRKSLAVSERLGDRAGMASAYLLLSDTAQVHGHLEEAEDWARKSLAISEELGDRSDMARGHLNLGIAAQEGGRLDEAEDQYRESLAISEELGDRAGLARCYHQLAVAAHRAADGKEALTAQDHQRLDDADDWLRESLAISEELGNRSYVAGNYHHLGIGAQLRGQWDSAEDWYRRSLAISEELGDRSGLVRTYAVLCFLAEERDQAQPAVEWGIKCVNLCSQLTHLMPTVGSVILGKLRGRLDPPALRDAWQQVTGQPMPQLVRDYVTSHDDPAPPAADRADV